jgi:hypothetical protein
MTAPERIYMKPNDTYENGWARPIDTDQFDEEATEYVRADLAQPVILPSLDQLRSAYEAAKLADIDIPTAMHLNLAMDTIQPAQVQPDPRDEVIARLVDALEMMRSTYPYNPPCFGWQEQVEAHKTAKVALAAAKEIK